MLEKTNEKRISAADALNHPFLTMDRPIYKFKKTQKEIKLLPMKMYHNFEEGEGDEDAQSPTKTKNFKDNNTNV